MIDAALVFLKEQLNQHLRRLANGAAGDGEEDKVAFLDGEKMDPVAFKLGAVTVLLINIEEENILRSADRYAKTAVDGTTLHVQPEIRLDLCVLFVAKFKQYDQSLKYLSQIIRYFQVHRYFDPEITPDLDPRIEKLIMELMPLPFSQQNDLWNALRTTYHPSVLYKVRMVVFEDVTARTTVPVSQPVVEIRHVRRTGL